MLEIADCAVLWAHESKLNGPTVLACHVEQAHTMLQLTVGHTTGCEIAPF